MSYSEFTIDDIRDKLNLTLQDVEAVIAPIKPIQPTPLLQEILKENIPLALGIDTEKARSELIVAPILVELRKLCERQISLFSGTRLFNQKRGNPIPRIYGAVTTGSLWKFMKLDNEQVYIELIEHFIENIESILGILMQIVRDTRPQ